MENVLCGSNIELIESQVIWYNIAIVLLGLPWADLDKLQLTHMVLLCEYLVLDP